MNKKPYMVKMDCPISAAEEEVFFYEVKYNGEWYLDFKGCDNQFSKCPECDKCHKEAYQKIITGSK